MGCCETKQSQLMDMERKKRSPKEISSLNSPLYFQPEAVDTYESQAPVASPEPRQ